MMENVIEARHLTKKFGNLTAIDDVSLSIKKGELFGLPEPNDSVINSDSHSI